MVYNADASSGAYFGVLNLLEAMPWLALVTIFAIALAITCLSQNHLRKPQRPHALVGSEMAEVKMLPNWIPLFGHIPPLILYPDWFLRSWRDRNVGSMFAMNLGGTCHNVVTAPSIMEDLFRQRSTAVDSKSIAWFMLVRVFGARPQDKESFEERLRYVQDAFNNTLVRGPHLDSLLADMTRAMEEQIPSLFSFALSPIDESPWERISNIRLIQQNEVEVNLFSILRNSLGYISTPLLMGQSFIDNYPDTLQDLWKLDLGIKWLGLGVPRWIPIRSATQAHLARARLLKSITMWHEALDRIAIDVHPGSEWLDLDGMSELMQRRSKLWRQKGVAPELRAAADLSVLWALNINANTLCFWLLLRILATPGLLKRVHQEIEPFVSVTKPADILGIAEQPQLKMSQARLATECPLFKSCFLETLRMHSMPWSIRKITEDFTVRDIGGDRSRARAFLLRSGSYVDIPYDLYQTDKRYFEKPDEFDPERFLEPLSSSREPRGVNMGTLKPYGGGVSMCKGQAFAENECLTYVAGILALWDIEPPAKRSWVIPPLNKATAVCQPQHDIRVRVRQRNFQVE